MKSNKDALAKTQTYEYNSLGLLSQSIDRNGTYLLYDYDEIGNITNSTAINDYGIEYRNKVVNPHGSGVVWDITYVPSGGGYSGSLQGIINNIHSPAGRLLQKLSEYAYNTGVADNFTAYQDYRYDKLGRVSRSLAGNVDNVTGNIWGSYTNYVYNKTRLEKVQLDGAGALNPADSANAKYAFYPDGKLKSVTFPPLTDGSILKSEYTYDGLGRLDTLTNTKGGAVLSFYDYAYDDNGNVTHMEETVNGVQNNTTYGYDKLNRLASVDSTKGNNDSYSYDFRGNMASSFEVEDYLSEDSEAYDYDELNRLYHVNKGGAHTYFDYTADGYRFVKSASGGTTFYVYDQRGRLCAEVKAVTNGTVNFLATVASYVWGSDRVLAKLDKLSEKRYYYLYNGHGDVVQVLDTSGSIANSYDYSVWGNFITKNETIHNPFTYFCQTYDESTGLYYLRARYYDPATGRFTQEDPATYGLNWYVYALNNPIQYVDTTGYYTLYPGDDGRLYAIIEKGRYPLEYCC